MRWKTHFSPVWSFCQIEQANTFTIVDDTKTCACQTTQWHLWHCSSGGSFDSDSKGSNNNDMNENSGFDHWGQMKMQQAWHFQTIFPIKLFWKWLCILLNFVMESQEKWKIQSCSVSDATAVLTLMPQWVGFEWFQIQLRMAIDVCLIHNHRLTLHLLTCGDQKLQTWALHCLVKGQPKCVRFTWKNSALVLDTWWWHTKTKSVHVNPLEWLRSRLPVQVACCCCVSGCRCWEEIIDHHHYSNCCPKRQRQKQRRRGSNRKRITIHLPWGPRQVNQLPR